MTESCMGSVWESPSLPNPQRSAQEQTCYLQLWLNLRLPSPLIEVLRADAWAVIKHARCESCVLGLSPRLLRRCTFQGFFLGDDAPILAPYSRLHSDTVYKLQSHWQRYSDSLLSHLTSPRRPTVRTTCFGTVKTHMFRLRLSSR